MLVFFLQKRSRLSFDESDEEEMLDLLSVGCATSSAGQSRVAEDAMVGPSELMDSEDQGDLSAAEFPEEGVDVFPSR